MAAITTPPAADELAELRERLAELEQKDEPRPWTDAITGEAPKSGLLEAMKTESIRRDRLRAAWLRECGIDPEDKGLCPHLEVFLLSFRGFSNQYLWDALVQLAVALAGEPIPAAGACELTLAVQCWDRVPAELRERLGRLALAGDLGSLAAYKDGQPVLQNLLPHRTGAARIIGRIGKAAGVIVQPPKEGVRAKCASAHDLRRSCADRLIDAGVPERIVSQVMRHASVETTRRHYTPRNVQKAAGVIREKLGVTVVPDVYPEKLGTVEISI